MAETQGHEGGGQLVELLGFVENGIGAHGCATPAPGVVQLVSQDEHLGDGHQRLEKRQDLAQGLGQPMEIEDYHVGAKFAGEHPHTGERDGRSRDHASPLVPEPAHERDARATGIAGQQHAKSWIGTRVK